MAIDVTLSLFTGNEFYDTNINSQLVKSMILQYHILFAQLNITLEFTFSSPINLCDMICLVV